MQNNYKWLGDLYNAGHFLTLQIQTPFREKPFIAA